MIRAACIGVVLALGAVDVLAAPAVEVSADTRRIYVGLPFDLQIAATGFDENPQPEVPELAIDGCEVSFAGVSPRVSRSLSIVNGRRTEHVDVTFVYRYRVTPKSARRYQVPAVEVVQGATRARSRPASFSAKSVPTTPQMKLRLSLPERPVWLGETFEMAVDWYVQADPSRPSFSIPLFSRPGLAAVSAPGGAERSRKTVGFDAGDHEVELPYTQERATLDGAQYTRLRFKALVTPQQAGTIELEPAAVVSELDVGVSRDRFFPVARTEVFLAEDTARTLEVEPLPQAGRPASFRNAVGTGFAIDVEASRTVVRVGEPIELEISLRGDVPLAGIALPPLETLLPKEQFEIPDAEPVGEIAEGGKKKIFRVTARLESADAREIPPIELAYFNPETGSYQVARSEPIALQVAGSAVVGSRQVASAATRSDGPGPSSSLVGADLSLSSASETFDAPLTTGDLAPLVAALYALPLMVVGFAWYRRRTAGARDARSARQARRRAALDALERAETEPGAEVAAALAAALRKLARERGHKPDGFDEAIAELETTAYNPRADAEPLAKSTRQRCRDLIAAFGALLLVLGIASPAAAADEAALDKARAVYREALAINAPGSSEKLSRFAEASKVFGEIVAGRPGAPEFLVDWGNASLGAREVGWAVLAYRRALHLDRGVSRARRNLTWVRGSLGDWPTVETGGAIDSLLFWHRSWNVTSRHLAAAICFALAVFLLWPWRRFALRFWARITAALIGVVFAALLLSALLEPDHGSEAVVVADGVTLRAADVAGAPAAIARPLPAGLEVDVVESRERWVEIALADGRRGWVPRSAIAMVVE
jgi:hypothetical protein